MKIPLVYPKIPSPENCPLKTCVAWEKIDGTNIHFVYEPELGWYSFGTRRDRFDLDSKGINEFNLAHPGLEDAPDIFLRVYKDVINNPPHEVILFFEFSGENSFAGLHKKEDKKRLTLIDAIIKGKLLTSREFYNSFGTYDHPDPVIDDEYYLPNIVYSGKYNGQFIEDVRNGKYSVNEGVVCKGVVDDKVVMTKIKTNFYMQKLKNHFGKDWESYWE